jgi:hypothetical protein
MLAKILLFTVFCALSLRRAVRKLANTALKLPNCQPYGMRTKNVILYLVWGKIFSKKKYAIRINVRLDNYVFINPAMMRTIVTEVAQIVPFKVDFVFQGATLRSDATDIVYREVYNDPNKLLEGVDMNALISTIKSAIQIYVSPNITKICTWSVPNAKRQ